jgi:hypothetical protein
MNDELPIEKLLERAWVEIDYLCREGISNDEIRKLQAQVDLLSERLDAGKEDNYLLREAVENQLRQEAHHE